MFGQTLYVLNQTRKSLFDFEPKWIKKTLYMWCPRFGLLCEIDIFNGLKLTWTISKNSTGHTLFEKFDKPLEVREWILLQKLRNTKMKDIYYNSTFQVKIKKTPLKIYD